MTTEPNHRMHQVLFLAAAWVATGCGEPAVEEVDDGVEVDGGVAPPSDSGASRDGERAPDGSSATDASDVPDTDGGPVIRRDGSVATECDDDPIHPAVGALAPDTWQRMMPEREPDGRNYSHPVSNGCEVFYFGGGHFSYTGSDIDFYDMSTNTWTRSWDDGVGALEDGEWDSASGRLGQVHTYQQVAWIPSQGVWFYNGLPGTFEFDRGANRWSELDGREDGPHSSIAWQTHHTFYSPELDAPVAILASPPRTTFVYNYDTGAWEQRDGIPDWIEWEEMYSTYVASRGEHLVSFGSGSGLHWYDAVADTWAAVSAVPGEVLGTKSLAYHPIEDVVVAIGGGGTWVLDVATGGWREAAPAPSGSEESWGGLWYHASQGVFFFLNRTGQMGTETWAYRY